MMDKVVPNRQEMKLMKRSMLDQNKIGEGKGNIILKGIAWSCLQLM